jgi:hypothetical protein
MPSELDLHKRDVGAKREGFWADQRYDAKRRRMQRLPLGPSARIASGDRNISTAGRIVSISKTGATVEVMFPSRGPPVIMLHVYEGDQIYEAEVRWRTDEFIGVRFLDILGSRRRRLFFTDQPVPLSWLPNDIIRLTAPPRVDDQSGLRDRRQ